MEIEEFSQSVMASSGATGSISVLLHPLVVMNISEHWTRVRAQEGKAQQGSTKRLKFLRRMNIQLIVLFISISNWSIDWESEGPKP